MTRVKGVFFGTALTFGLAFSACAPDRNLEQFNAGKRREQLQRIQEVSGVYRGEVDLSSGRGKTGFELQIEASTEAFGNDPRATVRGALRLGVSRRVQVGFNQAAYDPETHDLVLQVPLELMGGSRDQLLLRGNIDGNVFRGSLGFETHDSEWSSITLVKDGAFSETTKDFTTSASQEVLEGKGWPNDGGGPTNVTLSLSEIQVTNQHMMFSLLSNTRLVSAVISFGNRSVTYALVGEFNGRENVLRVSTVLPSPAVLTKLQCAPRDAIWACAWHTALGGFPIEFGRVPFSR